MNSGRCNGMGQEEGRAERGTRLLFSSGVTEGWTSPGAPRCSAGVQHLCCHSGKGVGADAGGASSYPAAPADVRGVRALRGSAAGWDAGSGAAGAAGGCGCGR